MENCYNLCMAFDRERFQKLIRDEFIKFRGDSDRTWSDFAAAIGVTQQTIAAWKNGYLKRAPDQENLAKLSNFFRRNIYSELGLFPPGLPTDEQLRPIAELILSLPESERPAARKQIIELLEKLAKQFIQEK